MKELAIFGAGGFGREVLSLVNGINKATPSYRVVGFFDDGCKRRESVHGFPILGGMEDLNAWESDLCLAVAIGSPEMKRKVVESIVNPRVTFHSLIHPSVIIGDEGSVEIGEGSIICAGTIITTDIRIGKFVILNLECTVGHDAVIKDYSSFMPACNISGEVTIGEGVYCGTGVKIINQTEIGKHSIVGAGAVVTKPVPSYCTAVGIPAKPIKFHEK